MDIKPIETYYNGYRFRSRLEARWAVFFDALGVKYEYETEGYHFESGINYLPDFYLPEFRCLFEVKRGGVLDHGAPSAEWMKDQEWQKILSITEAIKLRNEELNFDYIILASGSPYDCVVSDKADCGLVFNGIIGAARYIDENGKKNQKIYPMTEKDGLPVWGHMPVRFEELITSEDGEEVIFFGKRSYEDFDKTKGKFEAIPIGQRCASVVSLMSGIIPRYRGIQMFNPTDYVALDVQAGNDSPIRSACMKSRQARFEHGETPNINH